MVRISPTLDVGPPVILSVSPTTALRGGGTNGWLPQQGGMLGTTITVNGDDLLSVFKVLMQGSDGGGLVWGPFAHKARNEMLQDAGYAHPGVLRVVSNTQLRFTYPAISQGLQPVTGRFRLISSAGWSVPSPVITITGTTTVNLGYP